MLNLTLPFQGDCGIKSFLFLSFEILFQRIHAYHSARTHNYHLQHNTKHLQHNEVKNWKHDHGNATHHVKTDQFLILKKKA